MKKVVIIGAGISGTPTAFEIKEQLGDIVEVTVISDRKEFYFVPAMPWLALGLAKISDISVNIKNVFDRNKIGFVLGQIKEIFPNENKLTMNDGAIIDYDFLIITTGSRFDFDYIEGISPDKYNSAVSNARHAEKAFEDWNKFLKNPGDIVIGIAQGASDISHSYEYVFLIDEQLRERGLRDEVNIIFITPEPFIGHWGLGGIGSSRTILENMLNRKGIRYITNAEITKITRESVSIKEYNEKGKLSDLHEIKARYKMITPASKGVDIFKSIPDLTDEDGFIKVDEFQRSVAYKNIFAIGSAISIPQIEKTPVPVKCPKTCYMIETMISNLAKNLQTLATGGENLEKVNMSMICLTDFGHEGMVVAAIPYNKPREISWASMGRWVHLIKKSYQDQFMQKIVSGKNEAIYENYILKMAGIERQDNGINSKH